MGLGLLRPLSLTLDLVVQLFEVGLICGRLVRFRCQVVSLGFQARNVIFGALNPVNIALLSISSSSLPCVSSTAGLCFVDKMRGRQNAGKMRGQTGLSPLFSPDVGRP